MSRRFPGWSVLSLILWLTSLSAILGFPSSSRAAEPTWLRLTCADFSVYTDGSQRDLENFALTYAAFRKISRDLLLRPDTKVFPSTIILFKRLDALKKYSRAPKNPEITIAAFSTDVDSQILTAISTAGDREEAQATLFEFETIWTLGRSGYLLPTWMAQGAGEVFSSLEVAKSQAVLGRDPGRFNSSMDIPWKRFFEINEASPEYKGDKNPGVFHGQAWSLMHWVLLNQNDARERFQRISSELSLLHYDKEITAVLDVPVGNLTRELNKHFSGRIKTKSFPFDEKALRASWTVSPAPLFEVTAHRSDLLAAAGKQAEARAELDRATELAPEAPVVLEARARLALREGDQETAVRHYRRAIELGSKSPVSHLRSASARLDESSTNGMDYPGNAGSNAAEALVEIRGVLALDPQNLEAYRLLGRALFVGPTIAEKDLDELAPGLVPGDAGARVRHYRALLFIRVGMPERAMEDLKTTINDPSVSSADRRQAETFLARLSKQQKKR